MASRSRKAPAEDVPAYRALYRGLHALLCLALARLFPPSPAPPPIADSDAALAARLADCAALFVTGGHCACVPPSERPALLEQLLRFLRCDSLPVAATVVPAWSHLVQELQRLQAGEGWGAHPRALQASVAAATYATAACSPAACAGSSSAPPEDAVVALSPDCIRAVLSAALHHYAATAAPAEGDPPPAFDSLSEWRDFCGALRPRLRYLLTECALAAPGVALDALTAAVGDLRAADDDAEQRSLEVGRGWGEG